MFAFAEVIALLFGMSGFGLHANPHPATPDQVLEYGVADADLIAYVDAASIIPGNYDVLAHLPDAPEVKSSPELAKQVKEIVDQVEAARAMMKTTTGIDPVRDIEDATVFLEASPKLGLVAVRGHFTPQLLDRVATLRGGSPVHAGDATYAAIDSDHVVGLTHDGVLLVGSTGLVTPRLAHDWHPPVHHVDTTLGYVAEAVAQHAVFTVVIAPSKATRADALRQVPAHGIAHDLVAHGRLVRLAVFRDGLGWTWLDRDRRSLQDVTEMSEGLVDLLHAAQIAPGGLLKIGLGALDSYRDDPQVAKLARFRPQLEQLAAEYGGNQAFTAKVTPNPGLLRLDVRLTGKHAGAVLPLAVMACGAGMFVVLRGAPEGTPSPQPPNAVDPFAPTRP